jgi:hypothetical protein
MKPIRTADPKFAALVRSLVGDKSQRSIEAEFGINHATVASMLNGIPPSIWMLDAFATALSLSKYDRADLFVAAGYREEERPCVEELLAGLRGLGVEVPEARYLTPTTVGRVLAAVRDRLNGS